MRQRKASRADKIVLGQAAVFTGPAAQLGIQMRNGIKAYFDYVNEKGGVHGRKLELVTEDDRYEPAVAPGATKKLIEEHKVFALLGYVGTPTGVAHLPVVTQAKVPLVGMFTGAEVLRVPFNRYVFHVRASYYDETEKIVEQVVSTGGRKIAVFYQNDAYGEAGRKGTELALERRKMKIHSQGTVERNTVEVEDGGEGDPRLAARRGGHGQRLHVDRGVRARDAEARQRRDVLQRLLRRQQGAGRRARQGRRRRRDLAGGAVPLGHRGAGGQGIPAAREEGGLHRLQLQRARGIPQREGDGRRPASAPARTRRAKAWSTRWRR